jgi:cell division protein FtsX
MRTSNANVIVYIKKSVRHELSREISQSIAALQGVTSAVSSRKSDNMISVDYDSGTVGSQHILQVAREHGVPARLVGM